MSAVHVKATILSNKKFAKDHYVLTLAASLQLCDAQPGQFIHVRVMDATEPLLRRPLSIHRVRVIGRRAATIRYGIDIIYAVKGKGTVLLAQKRAGEIVDIIGPLGNGFDYLHKDNKAWAKAVPCLIAGGMGVAPLAFLAERITQHRQRHNTAKNIAPLVLIGAPKHTHIFHEDYFKKAGCRVLIATDDGSRGFKGTVVDLFSKKAVVAEEKDKQNLIVAYACGPRAMLKSLAKQCMINKIPLQVSLEEFMGCGIGACLGCAIQTNKGYKRVCSDGPVFWAHDVRWDF